MEVKAKQFVITLPSFSIWRVSVLYPLPTRLHFLQKEIGDGGSIRCDHFPLPLPLQEVEEDFPVGFNGLVTI